MRVRTARVDNAWLTGIALGVADNSWNADVLVFVLIDGDTYKTLSAWGQERLTAVIFEESVFAFEAFIVAIKFILTACILAGFAFSDEVDAADGTVHEPAVLIFVAIRIGSTLPSFAADG